MRQLRAVTAQCEVNVILDVSPALAGVDAQRGGVRAHRVPALRARDITVAGEDQVKGILALHGQAALGAEAERGLLEQKRGRQGRLLRGLVHEGLGDISARLLTLLGGRLCK